MKLNLIGPFVVNAPFGTEIAFAKGLRQIGVEVIEVDPNLPDAMDGLDRSADATLVFKSCVGHEKRLDSMPHSVITYQPDDARFPHIREMMVMMREYSDLFLSFDDHSTAVARTMGYRAAETLLLTADPELYCPSPDPIERDIDVSFVGSLGDPVAHASRRKMLEIVGQHGTGKGWKCAFYNTQHIPSILDIYRRSKVVLNHATDVGQPFGSGFGLQCRHFEVGMAGACLLANHILNSTPVMRFFPTFSDEASLIKQLEYLLYTGAWLYEGNNLYNTVMMHHSPLNRAVQLVDFITREI